MKKDFIKNKSFLILALSVLFTLVLFVIVYFTVGRNSFVKVMTYEDCVIAGGIILDSYPEQCKYGSQTFVRDLTEEEKKNTQPPVSEYYGNSTNAACEQDSDCVVMGCNTEICQGVNEEASVSICIAPEQPTPSQLGYRCGCAAKVCQWTK